APQLFGLATRHLRTSHDPTQPQRAPLAATLSPRYGLPILKILDNEGRVLSSAHWQAVYGLKDSPGLVLVLEAARGTRLVRERQAERELLALEAPRWLPPQRYLVIGGVRADSTLEKDLTERAGVPLEFEMSDKPRSAAT